MVESCVGVSKCVLLDIACLGNWPRPALGPEG